MTYKIGDIVNEEEYTDAAIWCNENNATMKEIEPDENSRKFEIVAIPEPTEDELKSSVRAIRNAYLSEYDFTQLDDAPFTADEKEKYKEYRQYLRDYTEQENWWLQNPDDYQTWLIAHHPVTEEE